MGLHGRITVGIKSMEVDPHFPRVLCLVIERLIVIAGLHAQDARSVIFAAVRFFRVGVSRCKDELLS